MAFLVTGEKMKANLKNTVVFIATAVVMFLVISICLAAAPSATIEVKGSSTTQEQAGTAVAAKPQAVLNDYENAVAALINSYRVASGINAVAY